MIGVTMPLYWGNIEGGTYQRSVSHCQQNLGHKNSLRTLCHLEDYTLRFGDSWLPRINLGKINQ
jgi:hypothetical protein